MSLPLTGQSAACACSNSFVYPDGSACPLPSDPTAILSIRRSRSLMRLVIAMLFLVLQAVGQSVDEPAKTVLRCARMYERSSGPTRKRRPAGVHHGDAPPPAERSKHNGLPVDGWFYRGVSWLRWECLAMDA